MTPSERDDAVGWHGACMCALDRFEERVDRSDPIATTFTAFVDVCEAASLALSTRYVSAPRRSVSHVVRIGA